MGKKKTEEKVAGSVAMARAGLKQGVYWLTPEESEALKQAAQINGQSIMSLVQHFIRTGSQKMLDEHRQKQSQ